MLADGSGAAPAAGTDQQASIGLTSSSAGPQEAALHLLANLTQVCTFRPLYPPGGLPHKHAHATTDSAFSQTECKCHPASFDQLKCPAPQAS